MRRDAVIGLVLAAILLIVGLVAFVSSHDGGGAATDVAVSNLPPSSDPCDVERPTVEVAIAADRDDVGVLPTDASDLVEADLLSSAPSWHRVSGSEVVGDGWKLPHLTALHHGGVPRRA